MVSSVAENQHILLMHINFLCCLVCLLILLFWIFIYLCQLTSLYIIVLSFWCILFEYFYIFWGLKPTSLLSSVAENEHIVDAYHFPVLFGVLMLLFWTFIYLCQLTYLDIRVVSFCCIRTLQFRIKTLVISTTFERIESVIKLVEIRDMIFKRSYISWVYRSV